MARCVTPPSLTITVLASILAVLALPTHGQEATTAEWPCFHGPRRDNRSAETGLLKKWPEGGPRRLWTATGLGKGYSSVSMAGGTLFTAGMRDGQTYVVALGLDGRPKWQAANGRSWVSRMRHATGYNGARSTPTCDGGRVFHLSETGSLACLEAATGKPVWRLDLFKEFDAATPKYGLAESVLIDGQRLICSPGGAKGQMVCLDKTTGKLIWACTGVPGSQAYCSPVIAELAGVRQVLSMTSRAVFGADIATGKLLWHVGLENARENNVTDPVPHNGHVYASSGYGRGSILVRLAAGANGVAATTAWASKLLDNHHGGVLRLGDHLYGAGHSAKGWFCLDFMTGKPAWNAPGKGSLTYADGMLYCLDERGTLSLVEATPEAHRPVSSFRLPSGGRGLYWAHPVVCGGRLYIRHDDKLFAYDIRAR